MASVDPNKSSLSEILRACNLKVGCSLCVEKENEVTYSLKIISHKCNGDLLLARGREKGRKWRHVSRRPKVPNPSKYAVCWFFVEGSGCKKHKNRCTFARSIEEATVWTFLKKHRMDISTLRALVSDTSRAAPRQLGTPEKILSEFGGKFCELCEACFHGSPQVISAKRWNNTCMSEAAHAWKPVLVHYLAEGPSKKVYNEVRQLPPNAKDNLRYCSHVAQGAPCWHGHARCQLAHSEVEMAVWKEEVGGGWDRKELPLLSQGRGPPASASPSTQVEIYCKACLLTSTSKESFIKHCASLEHARMISEGNTVDWKHRPPPHSRKQEFLLCDRPEACEYGDRCFRAHSVEELQEWHMRSTEAQQIQHTVQAQGLGSYRDRLLQEYRSSSNVVHIMSEQVDDVTVTHDEDLSVECEETNSELKWIFQIKTERLLAHVALLKQDPGAIFTLGEITPEGPSTYSTGNKFCTSDMSYDIPVSCKPLHPGLYEQWVVFDFDMRPVLLQKLEVRVGEQSSICPVWMKEDIGPPVQSLERWHQGNRVIIPCLNKTEEEEKLLKEYKPPQINLQFNPRSEANMSITFHNYRERMHHFLYREELAQEDIVSRLSLKDSIYLSDKVYEPQFGMKIALPEELFASVPAPSMLTPDTPEGFILKRGVRSALVAVSSFVENQHQKIYEAVIVPDASTERRMYLQLSKRCCTELDLQNNTTCEMEVQFQLNRLHFCMMHKAVDLLPDVEWVLPDLMKSCVPVHTGGYSRLNAKQQAAMAFIVGDTHDNKTVAPLLIYGPFGTGKTFTLATAAKELVRQPGTKVLICTYTNSSADLYVKDHFHHYVNAGHAEAIPLRIKANKKGVPMSATDDITLQYCHQDGQSFTCPGRPTLDSHRVIITTAFMTRELYNLNLPAGYFTHILIDEASQMLECEALMPLTLAGQGTRVVLAGDHMQMGPKLFSVDEDQRSNHTLLSRLFHHYQEQKNSVALKSRIIFNENYRSSEEIVDFVSSHFYGKSGAIKACGHVPPHPQFHSLRFHHVRGKCHLDATTMSWYNLDEVACVADVVQKLFEGWPRQWGNQEQRTICVLSEGSQVVLIRKELRKRRLGRVTVENANNVQGKQFRGIVMSTVHTRESLQSSHTTCLEFYNDPRVMNTVMTRAQSQVIVVGDAAALCSFGKCSRIWKSYILQCIKTNSAEPQHLTEDCLEYEMEEISRFIRPESKNVSDVELVTTTTGANGHVDEILQQLIEDYSSVSGEANEAEQSEDEDRPNFSEEKRAYYSNAEKDALLEMVKKHPGVYKHGELVMERFDTGYVMPFDNPTAHIVITGRKNLGMSFPGDELVVEKSMSSNGLDTWKVLGVTKNGSSQSYVCTFEGDNKTQENDYVSMVMVPLNKNVTKIRIVVRRKNRNVIPIFKYDDGNWEIERYKKLDEESKRKHVYVVRVVCWKEHCWFPLGRVTEVLPLGTSLDQGLKILDEEFDLNRPPSDCVLSDSQNCAFTKLDDGSRVNFRNVTTFTVDPEDAKDLDDAVSVQEFDNHYEIGVHIADVASFVVKDNPLDEHARERGATFYHPKTAKKEPNYMFPKSSVKQWSLQEGYDRRAVSLLVTVDKATNRIIAKNFVLSLIKSDKQLSYEEAEDIISTHSGNGLHFDTLKGCVAVAYEFSRAHRKARLHGDWLYAQPNNRTSIGRRKSHQMIEELMIMFNNFTSEFLIRNKEAYLCTPLRCQAPPDVMGVNALKDKYKDIVPLSVHLTHHIGSVEQPSGGKSFRVLASLWRKLQSAAERGDFSKVADLITTDDIHPQLVPAMSEFRSLLGKSYTIRSNSAPEANVGHYSLQLKSYTKASSPIRRYLDLILQRLLHATVSKTPVPYSWQEIEILCDKAVETSKKAEEYQIKAETFSYAVNLKKQNSPKLAFVTAMDPEGDQFRLSFPFDKGTLPDYIPVLYRDLQLEDQPQYDKDCRHMKLTWRRRVYSINTTKTYVELKRLHQNNPCTDVPHQAWQDIVEALKMENWEMAVSIILSTNTNYAATEKNDNIDVLTEIETEHYVDLTLKLKPGDTLLVQMTAEMQLGLLMPAIQLLNINEKFEVCLNHAHSPVDCFSKYAQHKTKSSYDNVEDYAKIWRPLCEMESASTAVDESESIIIEDLELTWTRVREGSFLLPIGFLKDWAIECNLAKCYLCIRKRDLKQTVAIDQSEDVDPSNFTWVAHGVTTGSAETKKNSKSKEVNFYILPMDTIPDCVYQKSTKFTVEIIPKLLPDVRKENAVNNLIRTNELVQTIALGRGIPRGASESPVPRWKIMREIPPEGLPKLNESQYAAIEQAMKNNFTVIQGPPGTGKTVVGAYIVYWFLVLNSKNPRQCQDPEEGKKKEVILYCGPSNKSVDVVAEYLLKFGDKMKPLRVYSRQMEMLEYPYPGSILQVSRKSMRQERSKPQLRSITMHHRIREPGNPHWKEIKQFDERIRLANESKEAMTDADIEAYKKVLNQARLHELQKHDVILCTCTAASTPNLTKTVSARQILIDECAMATEPQALVPLVSYKPEKVVLLGDHKQLRPIVKNTFVRNLGMAKSLFERYMGRAVMLDTQYRMHEDICEFPSMESYDGKLKTAVLGQNSILLLANRSTHTVFGHVIGQEISLVVTTEKGNENSKANREESAIAVGIAVSLVNDGRIRQEHIAILSPYNAQVSEIKKLLRRKDMDEITVSTITKSQGSEWPYVILSTVRSCPSAEIEKDPSRAWLSKNVGFVGDPNQINVGITRAQVGLCIIGNQELLRCSKAWDRLLQHYRSKNCVTTADDITVRNVT
ncbi:3'-5' exoribonuclease HELZ2-like isoform X1 [Anguilla rostrata]|uniref:3'-5' exoribonuclease HELZ2-like isoform X1 n=1 Tax=Anguilla rostrata TaxID=7938 RepID=UPI0030D06B71